MTTGMMVLSLIEEYSYIDGEDHKKWLLDQIVRCVTGGNYRAWVEEYEKEEGGSWEEGIAP